MADEINRAGFFNVELGFDTFPYLVPGIRKAVTEKRIRCRSLHNFCPVPDGFSKGHPEIFSLSSLDPSERQSAVYHTRRTLAFAAEIGADAVVTHAGNIAMRPFTEKLTKLYHRGKQDTPRYDRLRAEAHYARKTGVGQHVNALLLSMEELLPELEQLRIKLAFENLPSVEAIPSPEEQQFLFERFPSPYFCYWHDFGHAQVLQNLRIAPHLARLQHFHTRTAGMHIHDATGAEDAHLMPPLESGGINWELVKPFIHPEQCLVIEPKPGTPLATVQAAARFLETTWQLA
jgi:sugar phosphate isomerase/epimerase